MRVEREKLLHALESVQPGLTEQAVLEQSDSFAFRGGEVLTQSEEMACRCPSELGEEIAGAVPAKPLLAQLQKWDDSEIEIKAVKGELVLSGNRQQAGIRMEAEIADHFGKIKKPEKWAKLEPAFADALAAVAQCVGRDEGRPIACCVHFHPDFLEASDRAQFCRWRLKTGVSESVLVRGDSVRHAATAGVSTMAATPGWLHFKAASGLVLSCRRYLEDYPKFDSLIGAKGATAALPRGLVEAAERALVFSQENPDHNRVLIELRPGKLKLKGQGVNGWYTRTAKIKYDGPELSCMIAPAILAGIAKNYRECQVTPDKVIVNGDVFTYIAALFKPQKPAENG